MPSLVPGAPAGPSSPAAWGPRAGTSARGAVVTPWPGLRRAACLVLGVVVLASAACSSVLPPPAAPKRRVPALSMEPAPPVEGMGRIAIDAVGVGDAPGPYWVELEVSSTTVGRVQGNTSSHVCASTPCVANLPYGNFLLRVGNNRGRFGNVPVIIGVKPTILNVVVGVWEAGMGGRFQNPSYDQWEPADGVIYTRATD